MPKLRSVAQNEWKKPPIYIFFSTFSSKINEFEWKKSDKNEKFQKPKSCRQLSQYLIHTTEGPQDTQPQAARTLTTYIFE